MSPMLLDNMSPMLLGNMSPMLLGNMSPMLLGNISPMLLGNLSPMLLGNMMSSFYIHFIDKRLTFSEGYRGLNVSSQTLYPLWMSLQLHSVLLLSLPQQTRVLLLKLCQVILIVTH